MVRHSNPTSYYMDNFEANTVTKVFQDTRSGRDAPSEALGHHKCRSLRTTRFKECVYQKSPSSRAACRHVGCEWDISTTKHPLIRFVHAVVVVLSEIDSTTGPCPPPNERLQESTISASRPNVSLSESERNVCTTLVCLWHSFACLTLTFYSYKTGDRSSTALRSLHNTLTTARFATSCASERPDSVLWCHG